MKVSALVSEGHKDRTVQYLLMLALSDNLDCVGAVLLAPVFPPPRLWCFNFGKQCQLARDGFLYLGSQLVWTPGGPRVEYGQSYSLFGDWTDVDHCIAAGAILLYMLPSLASRYEHLIGLELCLLSSTLEQVQNLLLFWRAGAQLEVSHLVLHRREVIDIEPVIIPELQVRKSHLLLQLRIPQTRLKRVELQMVAALYYGLALAPQPDFTVGRVPHPELLAQAHDVHVVAVPDEDARLGGAHEQVAELAVVHEHPCVPVEYEYFTLLAVCYLELLHLERAWHFYQGFEPRVFEHEIVPVELFLGFLGHLGPDYNRYNNKVIIQNYGSKFSVLAFFGFGVDVTKLVYAPNKHLGCLLFLGVFLLLVILVVGPEKFVVHDGSLTGSANS